ncbi:MurR/RpiR family transcriptional regulator [Mycoplasma iguanae]|uniref:MurR/RpiR family transcriptional regulator n=1 Tax=Mycoplasma iguanae TaxID=292461 RepID=A0ABY5R8K2_9MOLU|nr:MurR/RpiR family transcriptional regulator [Mycoplasma iguanae]UVD81829.1 MurR/RpiR family transcriptional regulator [Mycoplasma iguanae]
MNSEKASFPIITKKFNLTDVEENILNFINSLKLEPFNLTSLELSKKVFCSEASISRFVKRYGFSSYRNFVFYVNKKIEELKSQTRNIHNTKEDLVILNNIHNYSFQNTINNFNIEQIYQAANLINVSKKIMCIGVGSSNKLANELSSNLAKSGKNVLFSEDFHTIMPLIGLLNKNSCVIVVSNNLNNKEIIFSIQQSRNQGAKIIVITSNGKNQFSDLIDIKILYEKIHDNTKNVPVASKLSSIIIIDCLFEIYMNLDKKYRKNIYKTDKILQKWRQS